ncbi:MULTISPECIES: ABC transporter permease [Niastella]|uniref:ABC transporter permease n=1 Tax=Niastella soli TaxID=2821487 RepID=A0ABS3YT32_9BACT|nr:ABC transporter permease [Niastella soli]MBO9200742.1 ABC transporter permease [Niastella soli]
MGQLLAIEWMKLKNYRAFWILFCTYLVTIFGANYIIYRIQLHIYSERRMKGIAAMVLGDPPYSFPAVWQSVAHVSSWLLFIPGLIIILTTSNEYSFKTHRQNIIDGWTRKQFITSKILLAAALAIISTLVVAITAAIFGFMSGDASFSFEGFSYIWNCLLQAMSYIMVALLMAILFKRGVLAIGVFFAYSMVLEQIIVLLLNRYANYAGRYLPLETTDIMVPFPYIQNLANKLLSTTPNYTLIFIASLVYLAIYLFITVKKFQTDDM